MTESYLFNISKTFILSPLASPAYCGLADIASSILSPLSFISSSVNANPLIQSI